jgi:4-hydroxythreonine-4-phosphate dehydrogenase
MAATRDSADRSTPSPPKPTIGITMGDPAGIGPQIVVKALADRQLRLGARFVVYGLNELLNYAADRLELDPRWARVQHDIERARRQIIDDVVVLDFDEFDGLVRAPHQPSKIGGLASKAFVEEAITDALRPPDHPRHIDALVTAPISKRSWHLAGFNWPGHTELLAHRTRVRRHVMMFDPIDLGHQACRELGIERPRIAVCGLNPHAGEQGQFGDEESRLIEPAVRLARESGIDAHGPLSADTVFIAAAAGDYDLVVAMYHDQGLIPVKLLGWDRAVNWTVGLPIVRTSPDHGTAFDIASRHNASAGSMAAAIEVAQMLAVRRLQSAPGPDAPPEEPDVGSRRLRSRSNRAADDDTP